MKYPGSCRDCGSPRQPSDEDERDPYDIFFVCGARWTIHTGNWRKDRSIACILMEKDRSALRAWRDRYGEVNDELQKAEKKFPAFASPHEGLAIIEEEVHELKMEVYKQYDARTKERMRKEAIQVAAMAVRFVRDLL